MGATQSVDREQLINEAAILVAQAVALDIYSQSNRVKAKLAMNEINKSENIQEEITNKLINLYKKRKNQADAAVKKALTNSDDEILSKIKIKGLISERAKDAVVDAAMKVRQEAELIANNFIKEREESNLNVLIAQQINVNKYITDA